MEQVEIAVVGGGASGLMAALTAAEEQKKQRRPVSVWVLEGAQKPGRKLLATGNGRCNLTNLHRSLSRYHGETEEARAVLEAFLEEVDKRGLKNVSVTQTGCIGVCRLEPIVEVYVPGQEKVTYVKMQPEMVSRVVTEHLVNHQVVTEYTIGAAE